MVLYGFVWVYIGFTWVYVGFMGLYGFVLGLYFLWVYIGFVWVHIGLCSACIGFILGLYGFIMVYMGLMDWFQNVEGKHMDKLYTKPWLLPLIAEVSDFLVSCSHHTILGSIGLRENMQQNHILLQQTPFLSCRFSMIFPSTQWEQWMYSAWWCQLPGPILVFKTIFQNTDGQLSYIEHI
jgi:hypothetical protein